MGKDKFATYLAPDYKRWKWNHIAVVRTSPNYKGVYSFLLYLNGTKLLAFKKDKDTQLLQPYSDLQFGPDNPLHSSPAGTLRMGRRTSGLMDTLSKTGQYYGLIDDVAVFNYAMGTAEINSVRKTGIAGKAGLIAGWTFDNYEPGSWDRLPPEFKRPFTATEPTYNPPVQPTRNDIKDSWLFKNPFMISPTRVTYELPFPAGEIWRVSQEFDAQGGSHNGEAAFCWDFVRADGKTAHAVVSAAASGKVINVHESGWDGKGDREPYFVQIRAAEGEYYNYPHLATNSFTDVFLKGKELIFYPTPNSPRYWQSVARHEKLAQLGPLGRHLHFAARDGLSSGKTSTIPLAFSNYQVSSDKVSWTTVYVGMPRVGEYIRRW